MGGTADGGKSQTRAAEATDKGRTGCVPKFREGQGGWRNRVRGKARRSSGGDESRDDAASGRRMEVAVRCAESQTVPLSGPTKAAGRAIDARGSFAAGGPVSCGQRSVGTDQRCGASARDH